MYQKKKKKKKVYIKKLTNLERIEFYFILLYYNLMI